MGSWWLLGCNRNPHTIISSPLPVGHKALRECAMVGLQRSMDTGSNYSKGSNYNKDKRDLMDNKHSMVSMVRLFHLVHSFLGHEGHVMLQLMVVAVRGVHHQQPEQEQHSQHHHQLLLHHSQIRLQGPPLHPFVFGWWCCM